MLISYVFKSQTQQTDLYEHKILFIKIRLQD